MGQLETGAIVFFRLADGVGGGVLSQPGKKAVTVATASDATCRVALEDLLWVSGRSPSVERGLEHVREVLRKVAELDLRTVWELLLEDGGEPLTLEDIAALSGGTEPVWLDAVSIAVNQPGGLFKRKGNRWIPLPRKVVEERDLQDRRTAERRAAMDAVLEEVRSALGGSMSLPALSPQSSAMIESIRRLALDALPNSAATRLLGELFPSDTRPYPELAFWLMVKLGVWDEHEDLNFHRFEIRQEFPPEVIEEAARTSTQVPGLVASRNDISSFFAVAIDDDDTVEVDDAAALEETPAGYRLHVLISDVASAIPRGSGLDREALARGSTVYHPARKIPMLPPDLSGSALSLHQGARRLVVDHVFSVDRELNVFDFEVVPAAATVHRRLTYDAADELLATGGGQEGRLLKILWEIALRMLRRRNLQGAVQFYPPEIRLKVSGGKVEIGKIDNYSPSRRMVAELMVACGAAVGGMFADKGIPAIYRCQPRPDEDLNWTEENARDPLYIRDAVRKLKRADISVTPDIHAALGLKAYSQVTSPLRRYGDLLMQRQLHSVLVSGVPAYGQGELLDLMSRADQASQLVRKLSDDAMRYWTLVALKELAGTRVRAIVLSADRNRAEVLLPDFATTTRYFPRQVLAEGASVALEVVNAAPRADTLVLRD